MLEESVTFAPSEDYPLFLTAKRYWLPAFEANVGDPEAITLLLLHATSFHKETWMPTLEALFALASSDGSPVKIREAWCLDCPNHGASGQLNATVLLTPEFFLNFSCEKYGQSVHHFLSAGPDHGAKVDFRRRNLVGIGHSLGGVAITILQSIEPTFSFSSLILVEPLLSPAGSHHLRRLREILVKGAYERRDVWPDREMAMVALKKRERTKKWDPRILKYLEYGILEHPGARYKEGAYKGVTLACSRDQEAAMYRDPDGATKPMETLNYACRTRPVHLVLGGINDFVPVRVHKALLDTSSGRHFASVTTIKEAGHLVPQEVPDKLGKAFYDALVLNTLNRTRSKL
ncbi:Alpha/beta hydrolase fold-1 [Mycena sp. CBHHK59/15]|nr:Alpha/beta hydrolase fold-1 [Mycena sp. CBHHK59/15]